jgi:hypothetical protein
MPCSYVIQKEQRLVIMTVWDVVTADEAMEIQSRLMSDPDFHQDFSHLVDLTAVSDIEMSAMNVRRLAAQHPSSSQSRLAFVASSSLSFGMARMFGVYREIEEGDEKVQVFADRAEALKWLLER